MNIKLSQGYFGVFIGDLIECFREDVEQKQLSLHFENKVTGKYLFDADQWNKIVNNLVSNAIKFTPPGGTISVSVDMLPNKPGKHELRLVVKDTGIGISKDQLPFITDRFYQVDNSLVSPHEGAGIGLALVEELVKLAGGSLEIESTENKGSVFTVLAILEVVAGGMDYPEIRQSVSHRQGNTTIDTSLVPPGQTPVILLVEDNLELRNFTQSCLEPMYTVLTASNGLEGLEIARLQLPEIIISDVMMPVMDGFDFCRRIKNNPATAHIVFIIVSAKANYESKMAGLEKGADEYLSKPFSVEELLSRIKNNLTRQQSFREYNLRKLLSDNPLLPNGEAENNFLQNIYKSIEDNLDGTQLTAEYLAAKMTLTEKTLDRQLIANIGISATELITQFQLKRADMQKQMFELQATSLRAQMNPHFIFNSLNSIKSLINKNENEKAAGYLTTFSKLIRTLFQNSDKQGGKPA